MNAQELTHDFEIMSDNLAKWIEDSSHSFNSRFARFDISGDEVFEKFMEICDEEDMNPIHKEAPFHECNSCKYFFHKMGNVAIITKLVNSDNDFKYTKHSIFSTIVDTSYSKVFKKLCNWLEKKPIGSPFSLNFNTEFRKIGYEQLEDTVIPHKHFYIDTNNINEAYLEDYLEVRHSISTNHDLISRNFRKEYIPSLKTLLDLMENDCIYRTTPAKIDTVSKIIKYLEELPEKYEQYELCTWYHAIYIPATISQQSFTDAEARFFNTALGNIVLDLNDDKSIEEAIARYERLTAPENYQRPKALVTEQMIDNAKQFLTSKGYIDSIPRRFATIDDVPIENVLYVNKDNVASEEPDIFEELKKDAKINPKKFDYVENISFKMFAEKILPKAKEVELYVDYNLKNNFMSLIAPINKDSKSMFPWKNALSWAYIYNLADSIKNNVVKAGGNVNGDLRFSLQWNDDVTGEATCDLDAHSFIKTSPQKHIYFSNMKCPQCELDIDVINPTPNVPAVENIIYPSMDKISDCKHEFKVHLYGDPNKDCKGFTCEIEMQGKLYHYTYNKPLTVKQYVDVATVTKDGDNMTIAHHLPQSEKTKSIWNIKLNTFVPVQLITTSPNVWENKGGIGHLFVFLKGCKTEESPNPWYNEFLNGDLRNDRRVMDVMAYKAQVSNPYNSELSGIGVVGESTLAKAKKLTFRVDGEIYNTIIFGNELWEL